MVTLIKLTLLFLVLFIPYPLAGQSPKINNDAVKVENLGTLIESATIEGAQQYTSPQNHETHFVLYYVVKNFQQIPFQIMDVNLDSGEARVVDAVLGRPAPLGGFVPHPNGKIYIASGNAGSMGGGYLLSYDPVTGQAQTLGKLADNNGAQNAIVGDDGAIYLGECIKGYVERYDPKTGDWENYGIIDDPGPPYYRYAYSLGSDGRYIYIAMGQKPWYLVIYDRVKKTQKTFWKDAKLHNVSIRRGLKGGWYVSCTEPGGKKLWYRLQGEKDPQLLLLDPGVLSTQFISQPTTLPKYELDLNENVPYNTNGGQVKIRWRKSGTMPWREASAQVRIGPFDIKRLYPVSENQLFGFTSFYGPMFTWQPQPPQLTILGKSPISLYDALFDAGEWFLVGYPSATLRYNPRLPWNPSSRNPSPNPRPFPLAPGGKAKYYFYLARGSDGYLYFGGHHERDSNGGALGWFNPKTGQAGGLRAPFLQYDVNDLVSLQNSRHLVFSGYSLQSGTNGQLFMFNVDLKQVVSSIAPLPGSQDPGKIIEVSPGVVLGVVKPKSGGSVSRIYKVNLTTGKVLFNKDIGGVAFGGKYYSDSRLVMGPEGKVWLYVNNTICRLDPADGSYEKVVEAPPAGNLLFYGKDLYIYGGTELRVIRNVVRERRQ